MGSAQPAIQSHDCLSGCSPSLYKSNDVTRPLQFLLTGPDTLNDTSLTLQLGPDQAGGPLGLIIQVLQLHFGS